MTTIDRVALDEWKPTVLVPGLQAEEDAYVGRHRKPGARMAFSVGRRFYRPRHLSR